MSGKRTYSLENLAFEVSRRNVSIHSDIFDIRWPKDFSAEAWSQWCSSHSVLREFSRSVWATSHSWQVFHKLFFAAYLLFSEDHEGEENVFGFYGRQEFPHSQKKKMVLGWNDGVWSLEHQTLRKRTERWKIVEKTQLVLCIGTQMTGRVDKTFGWTWWCQDGDEFERFWMTSHEIVYLPSRTLGPHVCVWWDWNSCAWAKKPMDMRGCVAARDENFSRNCTYSFFRREKVDRQRLAHWTNRDPLSPSQ